MMGKIRLACRHCDTKEYDLVDEIPADWDDIEEVQSLSASLEEVPSGDDSRSVLEWYTHLGICPECRASEEAVQTDAGPAEELCVPGLGSDSGSVTSRRLKGDEEGGDHEDGELLG